ncbi:MAG: hypothetical protein Q9191_003952 [Dirinaria sp. TL-2023a]
MQFKSILAVLSVAAAATASPLVVERNNPPPTCSNNFSPKCCDSLQKSSALAPLSALLGIDLFVGLTCTAIPILADGSGACAASQSTTCCTTGSQEGLINIGNICTGKIL